MTETPARRRAPGMNPDDRRDMIVAAALPLLVEHGANVSTQQIARAAGIGEATIFRAFTDKDELLNACVAAVLRNDHVLTDLDAVPLDQPLAARLAEAAAILHAYLERMGAVIGAAQAAGRRNDRTRPVDRPATDHPTSARPTSVRPTTDHPTADRPASDRLGDRAMTDHPTSGDREHAVERTRHAVIRLLEPEQASLRLPIDQLADIFLGILFGRRGAPGNAETPIETLIDVFLHGGLTR